ncbi:MAG TPA: FkbM family methyltransferase [Candidatus Kapabacteria bacterium]|nr:FkbM family methyltransferase [Candidatus Kapabacteria bacterium]
MASTLKQLVRKALRAYLTYTPIKKGRYPLMMAVHGWASEPVIVEVTTKDRGRMRLELDDEAQFPLYYNIYEWRDTPTIKILAEGSNIILDIGGNIGQMALLFSKLAKKVYTFEPIPEVADRLQENIDLNGLNEKIILSRIALTNFSGQIAFGLPPKGNRGTGSTVLAEHLKARTIQVGATTLDEFVSSRGISGVDFIKMDIEGAELFALQGMKQLLAREKPIVILEMTISMMRQAGYQPKDILDFLREFGYDCFEITKNGLKGPLKDPHPASENYCFLTNDHRMQPKIKAILID